MRPALSTAAGTDGCRPDAKPCFAAAVALVLTVPLLLRDGDGPEEGVASARPSCRRPDRILRPRPRPLRPGNQLPPRLSPAAVAPPVIDAVAGGEGRSLRKARRTLVERSAAHTKEGNDAFLHYNNIAGETGAQVPGPGVSRDATARRRRSDAVAFSKDNIAARVEGAHVTR